MMKNQLPGEGRRKAQHRCSVVEDPYKYWAFGPEEIRESMKKLAEMKNARRSVRKG